MTILAMDTSTPRGSVAVLEDGVSTFHEVFSADRARSEALFAALERARNHSDQFDRIVVGLGPGSYAGIRIAISAAIGMATGFGAELVGIPSPAAMASHSAALAVVGDARRGSFYFARVLDGLCVEGPALVSAEQLHGRLVRRPGELVVASEPLDPVPQAVLAFPSALRLAHLAAADTGIVARGDLEPIYLRDPHITLPKATPRLRST